MRPLARRLVVLLALGSFSATAMAQGLTPEQRRQVLLKTASQIERSYVLADAAQRIASSLRAASAEDRFKDAKDSATFGRDVEVFLRN